MKTRVSFVIFGLFFIASNLFAQVTIAPTNLFINSNNKFGTYMVINSSTQPQEVGVDFYFGYISSDENGKVTAISDDSTGAAKYSIADKVKAFPQNFILAPGQRQIVRIRIGAGNDIPDGVYWARIRTTSNAETPPLELQTNDAVTARVGITIEQVTGLFYKKGTLSTGIVIDGIRPELNEAGQLVVLTDLQRTGNSPFLGSITTSLIDASGKKVGEDRVSTSVYFDGTHKAELNVDGIPKGNYTIKVEFVSQRSDVSSTDLVQMEPATKTVSYTIR